MMKAPTASELERLAGIYELLEVTYGRPEVVFRSDVYGAPTPSLYPAGVGLRDEVPLSPRESGFLGDVPDMTSLTVYASAVEHFVRIVFEEPTYAECWPLLCPDPTSTHTHRRIGLSAHDADRGALFAIRAVVGVLECGFADELPYVEEPADDSPAAAAEPDVEPVFDPLGVLGDIPVVQTPAADAWRKALGSVPAATVGLPDEVDPEEIRRRSAGLSVQLEAGSLRVRDLPHHPKDLLGWLADQAGPEPPRRPFVEVLRGASLAERKAVAGAVEFAVGRPAKTSALDSVALHLDDAQVSRGALGGLVRRTGGPLPVLAAGLAAVVASSAPLGSEPDDGWTPTGLLFELADTFRAPTLPWAAERTTALIVGPDPSRRELLDDVEFWLSCQGRRTARLRSGLPSVDHLARLHGARGARSVLLNAPAPPAANPFIPRRSLPHLRRGMRVGDLVARWTALQPSHDGSRNADYWSALITTFSPVAEALILDNPHGNPAAREFLAVSLDSSRLHKLRRRVATQSPAVAEELDELAKGRLTGGEGLSLTTTLRMAVPDDPPDAPAFDLAGDHGAVIAVEGVSVAADHAVADLVQSTGRVPVLDDAAPHLNLVKWLMATDDGPYVLGVGSLDEATQFAHRADVVVILAGADGSAVDALTDTPVYVPTTPGEVVVIERGAVRYEALDTSHRAVPRAAAAVAAHVARLGLQHLPEELR